jgi:tRNA dimethylallyltransferase
MKKVIVICGPTSSGKTALSIELAKKYQLEIINGDSVQVYKNYDIGSAKIKELEREGIHHHLIDAIEPFSHYDVAQFQEDARAIINQHQLSMIVGGTGLYIKAALYDYRFEKNTLKTLETFPDSHTMYDTILKFDSHAVVDIKNTKRLKMMYQKVLMGQKPSENHYKDLPLYDILTLYLDITKDELKERLTTRLEKQIEEGFIEEVNYLKTLGPIKDVIGYREINMYFNQELTLDEAKHQIIKKSLAFAKRQKTWFVNQMHPIVMDATSPTILNDCMKEIDAWLI